MPDFEQLPLKTFQSLENTNTLKETFLNRCSVSVKGLVSFPERSDIQFKSRIPFS